MATITQTAPRPDGSPAPEYVTRKVGPLSCRFVAARALADDKRPEHVQPVPTVESIALVARQLLGAHAGALSTDPTEQRRRALLAPKATRAAAEGAVRTEHLKDAKGVLHTKAAYGPLVTLVRKQLVSDLRASFKEQDRADAEAKRQEARRALEAQRAREKAIAAAQKKAHCAVLPDGAKPSKALSKDQTRPVLMKAHLCKSVDGAGWQLVCTDSYQVCLFPLTVHGDAGLRDCLLDADVVKAIERTGAFRITKAGLLEPVTYTTVAHSVRVPPKTGMTMLTVYVPVAQPAGATKYAIDTLGSQFPAVRDDGRTAKIGGRPPIAMKGEPAPSKRMEITFNAQLLAQLAEALGKTKNDGGVTIVFDADCFTRRDDGVREWANKPNAKHASAAIRVQHANGCRGHLMPIRKP